MALSQKFVAVLAIAFLASTVKGGILFGSFTASTNGQGESVWQALNSWFQETNSTNPSNLMQSIRVINVGWSFDGFEGYLNDILSAWTFSQAVPVINWMPYGFKTWTSPTPNDDIADGKYDDYIDAFLGNLSTKFTHQHKSYARQSYIRFAPAPNGNWFPWSPTCPPCGSNGQKIHQTAASYRRMWNYVVAKIRSPKYGLTEENTQIMFDAAAVDESGPLANFIPDTTAATAPNWFSITGVNWGNTLPGNNWVGVKELFTPAFNALRAANSSLPMAISSAASVSEPNGIAAKEQWIQDLCDFTVANLRMMTYHNQDMGADTAAFGGSIGFRNFTSPYSSTNYTEYPAWRECVQQPMFVGTNSSSYTLYLNLTTFQGR